MNGLLNLVTQLSTFITGEFGRMIGILGIGGAFACACIGVATWHRAGMAVAAVAGLFSAAWLVGLAGG